ncbi:extensin family protein [Halodurantibacterium flavum]|uniref:Extensin family protein n=1 Tax=Halodurantibacterium flavum TaxID=1382802 RepID=A0ABW4S2Z7_9RHOB
MRRFLLVPAILLGAFAQVAGAEAPETSPRPQLREVPETAAAPDIRPMPFMSAAAATVAIAGPIALRPMARPGAITTPAAPGGATAAETAAIAIAGLAASPRPPRRPAAAARQSVSPEVYQVVSAAVRSQPLPEAIIGRQGTGLCGVPGIEGQTIAPITSNVRGCGVPEPVRVTAVDGVRLSQPAIVDCTTARALNTWVQRGVKPAVGRTGGGVVQLQVAGHYVCRPRNNRRGAAISEHGRGKAIDISGFRLANGDTVNILQGWRSRQHSAMLRQIHRSGCGIFGTTLGPGSDGMHEDHLHYDTAAHRNGPYCR